MKLTKNEKAGELIFYVVQLHVLIIKLNLRTTFI